MQPPGLGSTGWSGVKVQTYSFTRPDDAIDSRGLRVFVPEVLFCASLGIPKLMAQLPLKGSRSRLEHLLLRGERPGNRFDTLRLWAQGHFGPLMQGWAWGRRRAPLFDALNVAPLAQGALTEMCGVATGGRLGGIDSMYASDTEYSA
jgi:hypothetical protein